MFRWNARLAWLRTRISNTLPLRVAAGNRFESVNPVKMGTRFQNGSEEFNDVISMYSAKETDGTSYTLFPYPRLTIRSKLNIHLSVA
jgi:hypothetical protein